MIKRLYIVSLIVQIGILTPLKGSEYTGFLNGIMPTMLKMGQNMAKGALAVSWLTVNYACFYSGLANLKKFLVSEKLNKSKNDTKNVWFQILKSQNSSQDPKIIGVANKGRQAGSLTILHNKKHTQDNKHYLLTAVGYFTVNIASGYFVYTHYRES